MKQKGEQAAEDSLRLIPQGTVIEFDDGKHGRALLGLVQGAQAKAKGGARYEVIDAKNHLYSVAVRDIHCGFSPASTKPGTEPAVILNPFMKVKDLPPLGLGIEPELLELVWIELMAEGSSHGASAAAILGRIDASITQGGVQQYRAFRLLTSELGKIFFKALSDNSYKPKGPKAVAASKDTWCRQPKAAMEEDFCFV
jgi:hypothetical protein